MGRLGQSLLASKELRIPLLEAFLTDQITESAAL